MLDKMKYPFECALCDTKIRRLADNGRVYQNDKYNEIDVTMSDLSTMTVAVCPKHLSPSMLDLAVMSERVRAGWQEEVAFGIGNPEWVQTKGMGLQVVGVKK